MRQLQESESDSIIENSENTTSNLNWIKFPIAPSHVKFQRIDQPLRTVVLQDIKSSKPTNPPNREPSQNVVNLTKVPFPSKLETLVEKLMPPTKLKLRTTPS